MRSGKAHTPKNIFTKIDEEMECPSTVQKEQGGARSSGSSLRSKKPRAVGCGSVAEQQPGRPKACKMGRKRERMGAEREERRDRGREGERWGRGGKGIKEEGNRKEVREMKRDLNRSVF